MAIIRVSIMTIPAFDEIIEQNDQTEARIASLVAIGELVGNVYPNKFARSTVSGGEDTITALKHFDKVAGVEAKMAEIKASLGEGERPAPEDKEPLNEELKVLGNVRIAGRLTTPTRGNFVHLTDGMSKLQVYCNKKGPLALIKNDGADTLDEENGWALWQLLDHGDFVGVEGYLFVTNTGEVSVHVEKLQFLAKAMLPMPDKMHGIADAEIRQRQRYYDLIGSSLRVESQESGVESELTTREVFERRAKIISSMRHFLEDHGYIEVETPMLTPKATGAVAKPFKTHHNALDIDLYARIAPELYLKRLVVGGFEKVYELNRNFRNEGISYKHNPEFTMLEFYCAYMDVNGMMDFCEQMMKDAVRKVNNNQLLVTVHHKDSVFKDRGPVQINFENFRYLSMRNAVLEVLKRDFAEYELGHIDETSLDDFQFLITVCSFIEQNKKAAVADLIDQMSRKNPSDDERRNTVKSNWTFATDNIEESVASYSNQGFTVDRLILEIFDNAVESELVQPTFIVDYPKSISPLSKASPDNPQIAERFELFINGMEVANGFSELNDPKEQYERFVDQMSLRTSGDEEAMVLDEDYIRALSYGMPPAAGIGIGIDRLVMLLTNKHSIRDVILFPHMRPERRHGEEDEI